MKKIFKRFRIWLEDKITMWLFGETCADATVLIGIGRKFYSIIKTGGVKCKCCDNVWYPAMSNSGKDTHPAKYCPFCGQGI